MCPTCDHTMHNVGSPDRRIYWCPRCGTLKEECSFGTLNAHEDVDVPKLAERVKKADADGVPGKFFGKPVYRVKAADWLAVQESVGIPRLKEVVSKST